MLITVSKRGHFNPAQSVNSLPNCQSSSCSLPCHDSASSYLGTRKDVSKGQKQADGWHRQDWVHDALDIQSPVFETLGNFVDRVNTYEHGMCRSRLHLPSMRSLRHVGMLVGSLCFVFFYAVLSTHEKFQHDKPNWRRFNLGYVGWPAVVMLFATTIAWGWLQNCWRRQCEFHMVQRQEKKLHWHS